MPHVLVKMYAGRTEAQKARLAQEINRVVMEVLGASDASVSVGIEDVAPADWKEKVWRPDIQAKAATIYKKPGYSV